MRKIKSQTSRLRRKPNGNATGGGPEGPGAMSRFSLVYEQPSRLATLATYNSILSPSKSKQGFFCSEKWKSRPQAETFSFRTAETNRVLDLDCDTIFCSFSVC